MKVWIDRINIFMKYKDLLYQLVTDGVNQPLIL